MTAFGQRQQPRLEDDDGHAIRYGPSGEVIVITIPERLDISADDLASAFASPAA